MDFGKFYVFRFKRWFTSFYNSCVLSELWNIPNIVWTNIRNGKVLHSITILEADVGLSLKVKLVQLKNDQPNVVLILMNVMICSCSIHWMLNWLSIKMRMKERYLQVSGKLFDFSGDICDMKPGPNAQYLCKWRLWFNILSEVSDSFCQAECSNLDRKISQNLPWTGDCMDQWVYYIRFLK